MTRRSSNVGFGESRRMSLIGISLALFSIAVGATPLSATSVKCEPGSYVFAHQNGIVECRICPRGSFSKEPGSAFCMLCLDNFYGGEGANSAELWNGDFYCAYLGSRDDDFWNSISEEDVVTTPAPTTTASSTDPSPSPSSIPSAIATTSPSTVPSMLPSATLSSGPSHVSSTMPSVILFPSVTPSSDPSHVPSAMPSGSVLPSVTTSSGPSDVPSAMPSGSEFPSVTTSSGPSDVPSAEASALNTSALPSTHGTSADDVIVLQHKKGIDLPPSCNNHSNANSDTGYFKWHGQCRRCPEKHEMILYIIFVAGVNFVLIALTEAWLPVLYISHVWWGLEYLQMLYLLGSISSVSWSPAAGGLFSRVLPIFANDVNIFFSLQCIMGDDWPQHEAIDQLVVLSLPIILWIAMSLVTKMSSKSLIEGEESVSRRMSVFLHAFYLKLVLSSLEVIHLPISWSADQLSIWINSDQFYGTVAGFVGLLLYGIAFPFWFLHSIRRYNLLTRSINDDNETDTKRTKIAKKKNKLFVTLGVFPLHLLCNAWWWPAIWMLRKVLLAALWHAFPDELFLFLMVFQFTVLLSIIVQHYFLPFNEARCDARARTKTKRWCSVITLDAVLQTCLAALITTAFWASWPVGGDGSTDSLYLPILEDIIVLLLFSMSFVYLTVAIGLCCAQPMPTFQSVVSEMIFNEKTVSNEGNTSVATASDNALQTSSLHDLEKEIEFSTDAHPVDEKVGTDLDFQTSDYEYGNWSPYLVLENREKYERKHDENSSLSSLEMNTETCDSSIEDDTLTVYEEVWVNEATGEEIPDPEKGSWMDSETGMVAVYPRNADER